MRCGTPQEIGVLCRACADKVAPHNGLIPDHIRSAVNPGDAAAWVVDGFGAAHAIGAEAGIGRNHDSDLVVLASSVSREHAQLKRTEAGWTVRDLGSRNGTIVDGVRSDGLVALPAYALLVIGDVALWFLAALAAQPPARLAMATGGAGGGLIHYQLTYGETELCIVAGSDTDAAGALLWRTVGIKAWSERSLAPLEFQLLRALCARAYAEIASPSAVRGCVATKHLVHELPFQSKYANQENVRQVVLRVRGILAEIGARGALAVAPGRGYYLACELTASVAELVRR